MPAPLKPDHACPLRVLNHFALSSETKWPNSPPQVKEYTTANPWRLSTRNILAASRPA